MIQSKLRLLQTSDLASAIELSRVASWNQTVEDWQTVLGLDPESCFAIEVDNRIAATTTLLCYGTQLAWIGMVLTRPEYRRMGFAQRLVETALERAAALKIGSVKLDATPEGQPLYEKLGFKTEEIVERWFHDGRWTRPLGKSESPSTQYSLEIDFEAFGADRARLLRELAVRNPPKAVSGAYCFYRGGTRASYLGPCVAQEVKAAGLVIEQCLRNSPESGWYWDLLGSNKNALEIAREIGFVPQRRLERMALGSSFKKNDEMVYAIAGFELG